jgi:hypothetical protein
MKNTEEKKNTVSEPDYSWLLAFMIFFVSAFIFIMTCPGGPKSGLRGAILAACLLVGVTVVKKFFKESAGWKKRTLYSMLSGIVSGLLAAWLIQLLETKIGSPTLKENPFTQNTANLFFICPLYGLLMSGAFALAFKLPWLLRFLAVWMAAALASTFGLEELSRSPELSEYLWGLLKGCGIYYMPGLLNCFLFVLIWSLCAGIVCPRENPEKMTWSRGIISTAIFVAVFALLMLISTTIFSGAQAGAADVANQRFLYRNKDTVFSEKPPGIIILPAEDRYYDCQKKKLCRIPEDKLKDYDFKLNPENKYLRLVCNPDGKCTEIEKLENGKVIEKISPKVSCYVPFIVNKAIYYTSDSKLYRLEPPGYQKEELILERVPHVFCISPDEKFIAYPGGPFTYFSSVLCVMEIRSKKIRALTTFGGYSFKIYWFKNLDEFKERLVAEQKDSK